MQSRLGKCWFRVLLLAAYVLITGCSKNDMPFPRCISADYFGPKPIAVSAHFSSDHDEFIPGDGEVIDPETGEINYGFHHNQVVKWEDTGLETNGDSLKVRVNGAWTSWSNNNKKESKKGSYTLQSLEQLKYATKFEGKQSDNSLPNFHLVCNDYKPSIQKFSSKPNASCTVNCKCINEDDSANTVSRGAPCWFTNGHGAYLLFQTGKDDPNENLKLMRDPQYPTVHLGYNSTAEGDNGFFTLDRDNTKLKDRNCNELKLKKGWKIYVKILDRYYLDNVGGYSFEFLSGVQQPSSFGFFDYIYNYLKCVLLINENCKEHFNSNDPAVAQAMFENIAEKSTSFHNFVLSLLVLFVMISSLLYLFGMIRETKHDMLIRMMKITLVIVLISPGSFRFFYDHFLVLFVKGLEQLISVITNFAPNMNTGSIAQGDEAKLFSFMEDMFNKFFAYSVWKKFAAFLHYQMWASLLMIPAIFIGIVLYFLLCLYAYIIFLSGFMGIAFLIAIMPLFLISILFSPLKSLFEGWIKFCISFCLQSIMIFTLLSLLASMIMNTFYRQLGFTVCYNKWFEVKLCAPKWVFGGFCIVDKQYFGWTPGQIFVPYTLGEASSLNIDKSIEGIEKISREGGTIKFTGGAGYIPLPPDYPKDKNGEHIKGFRYIDYPFFNPIPGTKDNPADHYIAESDMVVSNGCSEKDLVRLTNSLSHASERADIILLINNIEKRIGDVSEIIKRYCQDINKCNSYREIINEIRSLVRSAVEKQGCRILKLHDLYKDPNSEYCQKCKDCEDCKNYQENSDYQRVQDIQRGYLINAGGIFILFLLSFLMFSLRTFVQQMGSSIAGGGFSVYNISSMYQASPLTGIMEGFKQQWQNFAGRGLESLGSWATHLPDRLAGGAANLLGRVPRVGGVLKYAIDVPRKFVGATIEATKFATSPENDVDKLEEKIYRAFGVDKEDITHRRIGKYLDYYKGYVGSHLGYTIEDAMKFTWEHGLDSIGKHGYDHNLLYRAKEYRRDFLEKLHDYTIGRKREPEKDNPDQSNKVERELGTELVRDNHDQPLEEGDPLRLRGGGQPDKVVRELSTEQEDKPNQLQHDQPTEEDKPDQSNEVTRNLGTEPKGSDEIDDFGSAFEGMEKRAEREGRRNQDKVYNLSPLFEMNTPEAVEKRAERARRKEERDRKDEVYNLKPLFKEPKNPEEYVKALFEMNTQEAIKKRAEREEKRNREDSKRKLPEPMRKPDAKGDEKRIEDED
ncbi:MULTISPECIES: TrbL/VirB6 family protein [unclassified Wolbachia]|uniref:type IV secretion system protein n=1 Tax=unclassified Wolbachia TaxID=2640676 RepID=UPI001105C344|nr:MULTISPECIES: type IV secretion system protein [unclassified Wolbachia]QVU15768.1 Type IV secretion system protein VirB6, putative [Wolbachia endosymbiont of Drosophila yakuba]QVU16871.1 Type IV secretion system protein VirB6, putative [Wolbachia endosymbiont of Drosophila santomea]QWE32851.1 Type IV secretion system protein VirB6, putative [Wolbachia endosymbiont of Drosophila simulans]TLW84072.1 conjugal transfer protein [Wolbachia endosymbiont of Drosophila teissieri]TLW85785.1 conjugal 